MKRKKGRIKKILLLSILFSTLKLTYIQVCNFVIFKFLNKIACNLFSTTFTFEAYHDSAFRFNYLKF